MKGPADHRRSTGDPDLDADLAAMLDDLGALWPEAPVVERPGVGHLCREDASVVLVGDLDHCIRANP